MKTNMHFPSHLSRFFRIRNVSDTKCKENQNTHLEFSNFYLKILPFMRKFGRAGQAIDYNMAHVHCMLDT